MLEALNKIVSEVGKNVVIVAATKMQSIQTIQQLPTANIKIAGENRVQELLSKYQAVKDLDWHFIGQLQTNKVKYITDKVSCIQSLDRISLANEIDKECKKLNKIMEVLIEVKTDIDNPQKGGVSIEEAEGFVGQVLAYKNMKINGLMTIMPQECLKSDYKKVYLLFEKLKQVFPQQQWTYLSMGMSNDYKIAVDNGSNMIRLGRVLFGERSN